MITLIDLSCLYQWKTHYETKTKEITAVNFPNQKTNKQDIIMNTSSAPSLDRQITDPPGINNRCKPASIAKRRWVAYAAAGAATALAGSQSAEAAIHYSGPVNEKFLVGDADSFKLDQPGDSFRLSHYMFYGPVDKFLIFGIASDAFRGQGSGNRHYVSRLSLGQGISMVIYSGVSWLLGLCWHAQAVGNPASASSVSDLIAARGFNMDGHGLKCRVLRVMILCWLTTHMPTLVSG